jgi:hypothetical protein
VPSRQIGTDVQSTWFALQLRSMTQRPNLQVTSLGSICID